MKDAYDAAIRVSTTQARLKDVRSVGPVPCWRCKGSGLVPGRGIVPAMCPTCRGEKVVLP